MASRPSNHHKVEELNFVLRVVVEPGRCWGSVIGEDSDQGACRLCVETCPDVFEKPLTNRCAHVRLGVDPGPYIAQVLQAVEACPVNAIHLVKDSVGAPGLDLPSLWQ